MTQSNRNEEIYFIDWLFIEIPYLFAKNFGNVKTIMFLDVDEFSHLNLV